MSEQNDETADGCEMLTATSDPVVLYQALCKATDEIEQLERERDEAREELHDIRLNLGEDADGYTILHAVCALQNERDAAMALSDERYGYWQDSIKEYEYIRSKWRQVTKERDDAQAALMKINDICLEYKASATRRGHRGMEGAQ